MYCPNCANEIKEGLRYCNSCGFRLPNESVSEDASIIGKLATGAGFVGVVGLIGFIFLIKLMLEWRVLEPVMILVSLFYLGCVFGLCAYTLSFIKVFRSESKPAGRADVAPQLPPRNTNQLEEPKEPPASVTDHTTRTLDKVPVETE